MPTHLQKEFRLLKLQKKITFHTKNLKINIFMICLNFCLAHFIPPTASFSTKGVTVDVNVDGCSLSCQFVLYNS